MSWRDHIFFLVPIPGIGFWLVFFGVLVLASPFLIPLLVLFLLGRALFKWRPWCGMCYTAATVALLVWGAAWVQQRYDPLRLREFRRVVLDEPAPIINGDKHPQRHASNPGQQRQPQVPPTLFSTTVRHQEEVDVMRWQKLKGGACYSRDLRNSGACREHSALRHASTQFGEGGSTWSITSTSTGRCGGLSVVVV